MVDTIAAVATPPHTGAIGIIRISGDRAVPAAAALFYPTDGTTLTQTPDRFLIRGQVKDRQGQLLDDGMAVVFRAPNSYTGEDVVELHGHGSPIVLAEVLRLLCEADDVRPARPGEFTKRAFLHGRMDLTRAEGVVDLITASTEDAARNAAGQVEGVIFRRLEGVYNLLSGVCAHFHALVDFPDEDIPEQQARDVISQLTQAQRSLSGLADSYARGRVLREGVACAIVGRPNVGKSSLLNALLGYERAIVTAMPGTTRDTLEEGVSLGGVYLRLIDTAGLRDTQDAVEGMGVGRARAVIDKAGLVMLVLDGSQPVTEEDKRIFEMVRGKPVIVVVNKADLPPQMDKQSLEAAFLYVCSVSAREMTGFSQLQAAVCRLFETGAPDYDGGVITNARHAQAVARAANACQAARQALAIGLTPDAALTEVESALDALGEITGRLVSEEILKSIFDRFCVGK